MSPHKDPREYRNYKNEQRHRLRCETILQLGSQCIRCGFDDRRALCIDHINGGGREHRKKVGGAHYFREILRDLSSYQLLCANCNMIKAFEKREFGNKPVTTQ